MPTETITVLCNEEMIALLAPLERSAPLPTSYGAFVAALYDHDLLTGVDEDTVMDAGAWWREMGLCNTSIEFDEARIRAEGILPYLCARYGISSERNVACALNDMAANADMTPIGLLDWAAEGEATADA